MLETTHKRSVPEEALARLLSERGLSFVEQEKVAGHKIDFIVEGKYSRVLVDVSGDHWHSWPKIVDSDRKKLNRVLLAGSAPFGVWWSRLQKDPEGVLDTIERLGLGGPALPWWDWKVDIDSLDPSAARYARVLLTKGETV